MKVIVMGCGRVGSELSSQLVEGGHDVVVIDKNPAAFVKYPPGSQRANRRRARIRPRRARGGRASRRPRRSSRSRSGDNSNIVSARVALEHYHVPKVVARIYDPRRADIYERLNIPTVATTKWGVKQIQLMLFHDRSEVRESLGGGDLVRLRVPVPRPPGGQAGHVAERRRHSSWSPASRAAAAASSRRPTRTLQEGDYLARHHGEGRHGPARLRSLAEPDREHH